MEREGDEGTLRFRSPRACGALLRVVALKRTTSQWSWPRATSTTCDCGNRNKREKTTAGGEVSPTVRSTVNSPLALSGTLVAKKNSRIVRIDLAGPAIVAGTKAVDGGYRGGGSAKVQRAKTISGTGTATLTTTYVYP